MVTFIVLSEYSQDPPTEFGRIKIARGPLYDLARVQALVADDNKLLAWTQKCRKDVDKFFSGEIAEVANLVQCLQAKDYIDSEWCENGRGHLAACDAYQVSRLEVIPATGQQARFVYFLKFAIGKTGNVVLVVSCHTS